MSISRNSQELEQELQMTSDESASLHTGYGWILGIPKVWKSVKAYLSKYIMCNICNLAFW